MPGCFSIIASRDRCLRYSFSSSGLKSTTTDLGDGTVMHCWAPKNHSPSKPTLLLIHGIGANAMWQWHDFVSPLASRFNLYIPDLVFFGDSYSSRPERSEIFQARCVMALMDAHGVKKMMVTGISYGGFVAYRMAAQFGERIDRLVLCCAGVCTEEKDMENGMFQVKSVEEAMNVLLPQKPQHVRDLMKISFYKPVKNVPSCFLNDFIEVMCSEHLQERKELIQALHKDRKLSDLPKINHPTLIIWGEHDLVFPLELAHRLKRQIGESANLVIIKNAGHAINAEKPKEMCKHMKSFLIDPLPTAKHENHSNGRKVD
ncbi:hypothetical protein FF1_000376 [Malus domestica]|uniref:AB hydrolase-1 domain-containing protein n=1 Tax=Malus domestica TaxID=3750 RepID=A0A498KWH9_MALDO|nr:uncharacterized protein LOC103436598 [Malus domestica]RXI09283.1 hypothetical protein DVH24_033900 [Malus domestica]